jgi:hypothetical protein
MLTSVCWCPCRSLRQAPEMADAVSAALAQGGTVQAMSEAVWDALWSKERRQQVTTTSLYICRGHGSNIYVCQIVSITVVQIVTVTVVLLLTTVAVAPNACHMVV